MTVAAGLGIEIAPEEGQQGQTQSAQANHQADLGQPFRWWWGCGGGWLVGSDDSCDDRENKQS